MEPDWKSLLIEVPVSLDIYKLITWRMTNSKREILQSRVGFALGMFLHAAAGGFKLWEWLYPELELFGKLPEILREFPALRTVRVLGYQDRYWKEEVAGQGLRVVDMEFDGSGCDPERRGMKQPSAENACLAPELPPSPLHLQSE